MVIAIIIIAILAIWYGIWITVWVKGTKKNSNAMIIFGALFCLALIGVIIAAIQISTRNSSNQSGIELERLKLERERLELEKNRNKTKEK